MEVPLEYVIALLGSEALAFYLALRYRLHALREFVDALDDAVADGKLDLESEVPELFEKFKELVGK